MFPFMPIQKIGWQNVGQQQNVAGEKYPATYCERFFQFMHAGDQPIKVPFIEKEVMLIFVDGMKVLICELYHKVADW
jgi:hypothetical protein